MKICWFCGNDVGPDPRPSRDKICPKCRMSLKCCKNCRFFDPSAHNQCTDPAAEWVRDKELANFCEFFELADRAARPKQARPEEARRKFDDLFNKK